MLSVGGLIRVIIIFWFIFTFYNETFLALMFLMIWMLEVSVRGIKVQMLQRSVMAGDSQESTQTSSGCL